MSATTAREAGPLARRRTRGRSQGSLLWLAAALAAVAALTVGLVAAAVLAPPRAAGAAPPGAGGTTGGQEAQPAPPGAATTLQPFAVGLRVLRLIDRSRSVRLPGGRAEPRRLLTYVRYPVLGAPGQAEVRDAPAASADGPFPLVVFGHGFGVTPQLYASLLRSWTRAGYVVAAPVFPLAGPGAPGGPTEADLVNQPRDMSYVISSLLAASAAPEGPLKGLLDPARVAVAGHSDGGVTALAAAYSGRLRDPRVGAAVVLSGAEMSGVGGFPFAPGSPPLLAVQGTADTTNEPRFTYRFFGAARRPKYLLRLLGARHLTPYTRQQPQLGLVERVSIAFLDGHLKRTPGALRRLRSAGDARGVAAIAADP